MTEQLLQQQLESPSGTGRVEPRSDHQLHRPLHPRTGCQPTDPILTGRYCGTRRGFLELAKKVTGQPVVERRIDCHPARPAETSSGRHGPSGGTAVRPDGEFCDAWTCVIARQARRACAHPETRFVPTTDRGRASEWRNDRENENRDIVRCRLAGARNVFECERHHVGASGRQQ